MDVVRYLLSKLSLGKKISLWSLAASRSFIGFLDLVALVLFAALVTLSTEGTIADFSPLLYEIIGGVDGFDLHLIIGVGLIAALLARLLGLIAVTWIGARYFSRVALLEIDERSNLSPKSLRDSELFRKPVGDAFVTLKQAPVQVFRSLPLQMVTLIGEAISATIILLALLASNPVAVVVGVPSIGFLLFLQQLTIGRKVKTLSRKRIYHDSGSDSFLVSLIGNLKSSVFTGLSASKVFPFRKTQKKAFDVEDKITTLLVIPTVSYQLLAFVSVTILLILQIEGALGFAGGAGGLAILAAGLLRIAVAIPPIENSINFIRTAESYLPFLQSLEPSKGNSGKMESSFEGNIGLAIHSPTIEVGESRSIAYAGLNIGLKPGDWLTVEGPSGSGKSTLLQGVLNLLPCSSGQIALRDLSTEQILTPEEVRSFFIPDRLTPIETDVIGNINHFLGVNQRPVNGIEIENLLEELDFDKNTIAAAVESNNLTGPQLSNGQLFRLRVISAILFNPKLLVIDEAISSLDDSSLSISTKAIQEYLPDAIVIVAGHRLWKIPATQRITI